MNVVLDNNALVYLLQPKARRDVRSRLRGLLADVERTRGQLLLPAPVVAEFLSHISEHDSRERLMNGLRQSRFVAVAPFDEMAAVECSLLDRRALASGNKREPLNPDKPWQAVKIDRQIVAIALSRRASIVSGDSDVLKMAGWANVQATRVEDLPIPESERQLLIAGVQAVEPPARRMRLGASKPSIVPADPPKPPLALTTVTSKPSDPPSTQVPTGE